jgi:MYXO-CTERM domain-containing protein
MHLRFTKAALVAALTTFSFTLAHAEQFQAGADIFNGSGYGASYVGAGGNAPVSNQALGQVVDGGNNAFDAFGFYNRGVGSLSQARQVELLSGNVYRFFDTFTNTGTTQVTTTLNFFGNLGSDGDELVSRNSSGLVITCTDDGAGSCTGQPVLALVSGNNGLGQAALTPDRYNVSFAVSLAPGQSLSLLNFAFLASDVDGPTSADQLLAERTGLALLAAPRLDGLSAQQVASVANFTISPVPEPGSWALALGGLLALGMLKRREHRSH